MKRGRLGCRAGFCAGLHPMRGASVRVIGRRTGNICQGFVKNSDDFTQGVESGRKYVAATAIDIREDDCRGELASELLRLHLAVMHANFDPRRRSRVAASGDLTIGALGGKARTFVR